MTTILSIQLFVLFFIITIGYRKEMLSHLATSCLRLFWWGMTLVTCGKIYLPLAPTFLAILVAWLFMVAVDYGYLLAEDTQILRLIGTTIKENGGPATADGIDLAEWPLIR